MESIRRRMEDLAGRDAETLKMGGGDQVDKQHKQGKLSARERVGLFFDDGSFQEIDRFVHHRSTRFGMDKQVIPSDGVVTGHGLVNQRPVFASPER